MRTNGARSYSDACCVLLQQGAARPNLLHFWRRVQCGRGLKCISPFPGVCGSEGTGRYIHVSWKWHTAHGGGILGMGRFLLGMSRNTTWMLVPHPIYFSKIETKRALRPCSHRTRNATQSKWNLCAQIGVFTLHASNIKGFAFEFVRARPVWMRPIPL